MDKACQIDKLRDRYRKTYRNIAKDDVDNFLRLYDD